MSQTTPTTTATKKRALRGVVVSDKMTKTIVVEVTRLRKHPIYKKYVKVSRKFMAHDEAGKYHVGDKVTIQETRPMSRHKRWTVAESTTA